MRQLGPLDRDLFPGDGEGVPARRIGNDGDLVVLADPAALFLQPPDALLDGLDGLLGAGSAQAISEFGQTCLELLDEACADGGLLGLAPGGVTIEPDLGAILAQGPLQLHGFF